jgi:hypothetical protein
MAATNKCLAQRNKSRTGAKATKKRTHVEERQMKIGGRLAVTAPLILRLSIPGEQVSRWRVPPWLHAAGLTYHGRPDRWLGNTTLIAARRGQEFISDTSNTPDAAVWLDSVKAAIAGGAGDHG